MVPKDCTKFSSKSLEIRDGLHTLQDILAGYTDDRWLRIHSLCRTLPSLAAPSSWEYSRRGRISSGRSLTVMLDCFANLPDIVQDINLPYPVVPSRGSRQRLDERCSTKRQQALRNVYNYRRRHKSWNKARPTFNLDSTT